MGMTTIRKVSQRMLKGIVVILVVAMAAGFFFIGPKFGASSPDLRYHGPAVRVNGIKLKDADYQEKLDAAARQANEYRAYGIEASEEQIREDALRIAIQDLVVQAEIKRNKVRVPGGDVDRFFNRYTKQFPTKEERYSFYGQYNIKGDRGFKQEIRRYLEEQRLYLRLSQKKEIDVKASAAEVSEAYASVNVNHILIGTQKDVKGALPEAEARKKVDEVYAKLKAGEDWDKLAKEYSTDASNKDKGGSLGESKITEFKAQLDKDFVEAALKLKVGEYSVPVKTQFGYHVIKMIERKDATGPEFRKEAEEIQAQLIYQKFRGDSEKFKKWIDARVADADVVILDPALRAYQLKANNQWAEAVKFYERAVKMRQHKWDRGVFLSALEVFSHEKLWDKAVRYGKRILKTFKEDMELNAAVGKALYRRGKGTDKTEGSALLRKAKSLAGEDPTGLTTIKKVYDELKLTKEAKALEAEIKKLIEAQLKEQEQQQQLMEEEQKKVEEEQKKKDAAAKSGQ